ncbi:TonB-dependent receptor [Piscinibacter aquaticus]|uniref:TonB-dependent receptor n=1 Tax=Piscinibacter aquaticus TaxID=392597 RepID=A0A5C6U0S3_9BURK|nr:TonB-dependent receptor [Piscinibacter aquaticus]
MKLAGDHRVTAELLTAKSEQTSRIAPVPGSIPVPVGSLPTAVQGLPGLPATGNVTARYRVFDLGQRTSVNKSDLLHFTLGAEGTVLGWDYGASIVHSVSKSKIFNKGYPEQNALFTDVLFAGLLDPFVGPGQQTQGAIDALQGVLRNGYYNGGKSTLDMINAKVSREIMPMAGGALSIGLGANFGIEKNNNAPSPLAQGLNGEVRFGDEAAVIPYSAQRKVAGAFAELVAPVTKTIETSGAVRFDKYQGVGESTNGKVAVRWQPSSNVLLRGSIGTGFRAPTVKQVKSPEESFGVTSDQYDCSTNTALQQIATGLGAVCRPDGDQYDVFAGGNLNLKPEKSKQASFGIVLEPSQNLSFGADYWVVGIRDSFGQIPESEFFANPTKYASSFRTKLAGTGENYLAIFQGNANLGNSWNAGIDFNVIGRFDTALGGLTSQLTTTYMLRNRYQLLPGDAYFSSLGRFGEDTTVTFRIQGSGRIRSRCLKPGRTL